MKRLVFSALVAMFACSTWANNNLECVTNEVDSSAWAGLIEDPKKPTDNQPNGQTVERKYKTVSYLDLGYSYYNLSTESSDGEKYHGFNAGYAAEVSLSKSSPVFMDLGLYISWGWNSDKASQSGYTAELSQNFGFFKVPISLMYKIYCGKSFFIAPYAGLNFKVAVGGSSKMTVSYRGDSEKVSYDWFDEKGFDYSRFMMGWQAGVKFGGSSAFFGVFVGTDFVKMDSNLSQLNVGVNLGFYF